MPALDWITVEGFRSIASIQRLSLRPINVLIGPNGSGKSNLIEVFAFLNAIRNGGLRNYVSRQGGIGKIMHCGSRHTPRMTIRLSFDNGKIQYEIELRPDSTDGVTLSRECVYSRDKSCPAPYGDNLAPHEGEAGISDPKLENRIGQYVRSQLDRWRLYHFHDTSMTSAMKKMSDVNDTLSLRSDGSNLAAYLHFLQHSHKENFDLVRRTVQLAAPFFGDFQLKPPALTEDSIRLEWRHRGSDARLDASSLSDGTLRFMALATLLLQPPSLRPSVIFMDEPELGLHPCAVTLLASLVRQAATDTPIVLATQSSLLLDHFDPEDVLVADRVGGATRLTRLDPDKLTAWPGEYSLGQLWEKNEFGGRPEPEA